MPEKLTLEQYQRDAVDFITSRPHSLLASSVGLGKTAVVLEAFSRLRFDGVVKGMLVIAPLRVARYSWPDEVRKWADFNWIKIADLRTEQGQIACRHGKAHVYTINLESLPKICEKVFKRIGRTKLPFDMVVVDECHQIKNPQGKRIKEFYQLYNGMMKVRVGLTGTPASNSLIDLFAQVRFLDGGKRFGVSPGKFKAQYFKQADYMGYRFEPREGARKQINEKMADLMLVQSSEDFSDQPDTQVTDIDVVLPPEAREIYKGIKKDFLAELKNGGTITAANAAVLMMKLLQITGGYCYGEDGKSEHVHNAKINALKKLCAGLNEPVLIVANFKHETEAILKAIPECERWNDGSMIHRWNRGEVKALVVHPKSVGTGINLQKGGSVLIWYGLTHSLTLSTQMCGRLFRKGQTKKPRMYRLIAVDSVDELVAESLRMKCNEESSLLLAVKLLQQK